MLARAEAQKKTGALSDNNNWQDLCKLSARELLFLDPVRYGHLIEAALAYLQGLHLPGITIGTEAIRAVRLEPASPSAQRRTSHVLLIAEMLAAAQEELDLDKCTYLPPGKPPAETIFKIAEELNSQPGWYVLHHA